MSGINLPKGYSEIRKIDLMNNKREALLVNGFSLIIFCIMLAIGMIFVPLDMFFKIIMNKNSELFALLLIIPAIVLYAVTHEIIHGIFIKKYSGIKAKYGFNGVYAYAGSEAVFNKKQYIIIALSPLIIWGLILVILNIIVPKEWFWFIYLIQITNISGAAGDLYILMIIRKLSYDILIQDSGLSMKVYSKINYLK